MTIIALLNTSSSPLLLSDMLLSRDRVEESTSSIYLPILGDIAQLEQDIGHKLPFTPTRMVRKQFIVNEHVHVAWAGDLSAGLLLRSELLRLCVDEQDTKRALDQAVSSLSMDQQRSLSAIVVRLPNNTNVPDWTKGIAVHPFGCIEYESSRWGKCYFGGSGGESLQRWIASRDGQGAASIPDRPDELAIERLCAQLVFSEALLTCGNSSNPFSPILESGCGGFYEGSLFRPGGVVVQRNAFHAFIRLNSDGTISLTRLFVYLTKADPDKGRVAIVAALVSSPVPLDPSGESASFVCEVADFVYCLPFWSDDASKAHVHIRSSPQRLFADSNVPMEVVTVTMYQEEGAWTTNFEEYDTQTVLDILEADGFRNQAFVTYIDSTEPEIAWEVSDTDMFIRMKSDWLSDLLTRFGESKFRRHLVVRSSGPPFSW